MAAKRTLLAEFITCYRNLPILWDTNHQFYSNRKKKSAAYNELLEKYKSIDPKADRDCLVKKINSLRTNFRKEWRKVRDSKYSGAPPHTTYTPSMWYFEDLMFLVEHEIRQAECKTDLEEEVVVEASEKTPTNSKRKSHSHQPSIPKKKKKKDTTSTAKEIFNLAAQYFKEDEDVNSILAKGYVSKLKKLNSIQRLYADRLINEVLLEAQLENLNRYSAIANAMTTTSQSSNKSWSTATNATLVSPMRTCSNLNSHQKRDTDNKEDLHTFQILFNVNMKRVTSHK